jgi:hypothetical protein
LNDSENEFRGLWEATARLQGPFVGWSPTDAQHDVDGVVLELGHPGVIVERGPRHLSVLWIDHEGELISVGAVYDAGNVRQIDVRTFCRRVLALATRTPG